MATPGINPLLPTNPYLAAPRSTNRSRSATPTRMNPGPSTRPANHGSATQTITSRPDSPANESLVLRLRGAHTPTPRTVDPAEEVEDENGNGTKRRRQIQWAESVIDNEGLGRKKSKVCCIYHKPRAVGESSSEEDSSDSDSSSGDSDGARPVGGRKGRKKGHKHDHGDGDDCNHDYDNEDGHRSSRSRRKPSPNAYEKMPKYDVKPLSQQPGQKPI